MHREGRQIKYERPGIIQYDNGAHEYHTGLCVPRKNTYENHYDYLKTLCPFKAAWTFTDTDYAGENNINWYNYLTPEGELILNENILLISWCYSDKIEGYPTHRKGIVIRIWDERINQEFWGHIYA